jgi:hypothetical protein
MFRVYHEQLLADLQFNLTPQLILGGNSDIFEAVCLSDRDSALLESD